MATRDELWWLGDSRTLTESRAGHGAATQRGDRIDASDRFDDPQLRDELVGACEEQLAELRDVMPELSRARVRLVAAARCVVAEGRVARRASGTMSVTVPYADMWLSIVTTSAHVREDVALLTRVAARTPELESVDVYSLPLIWRHGSAAVLLHEACGHPAEHGHSPVPWPEWLSVRDEPLFELDDAGGVSTSVNLLVAPPASLRRESFRDVPLARMSCLAASGVREFERPAKFIDVVLIAGGAYEPLTETVSLQIAAADLVNGDETRRLAPFELRASRAAIARALIGATGEPFRYPGVVCSREGQEVVVDSAAPVMLTDGALFR